jgi:predicted dehydrogenase
VNGEGTNNDWGSIYKNLKNVLEGKEELFVKPEEVLHCMRVIEAAFISAKENRVVYLD